jgi:hypothetical protein
MTSLGRSRAPKWEPLTIAGGFNGELRRRIEHATGAYAVRRKDSHRVIYVGESSHGTMWKTLLRHFQVPGSTRASFTVADPTAYEVAIWQTGHGHRPRKSKRRKDQRAMRAQAIWIRTLDPEKNEDDGLAFAETAAEYRAAQAAYEAEEEERGAFDGLINPSAIDYAELWKDPRYVELHEKKDAALRAARLAEHYKSANASELRRAADASLAAVTAYEEAFSKSTAPVDAAVKRGIVPGARVTWEEIGTGVELSGVVQGFDGQKVEIGPYVEQRRGQKRGTTHAGPLSSLRRPGASQVQLVAAKAQASRAARIHEKYTAKGKEHEARSLVHLSAGETAKGRRQLQEAIRAFGAARAAARDDAERSEADGRIAALRGRLADLEAAAKPAAKVTAGKDRHRARDGRFTDSDFAKLCVCGHTLGQHTAGNGRGAGECLAHEDGGIPGEPCECEKFRASRAKGKPAASTTGIEVGASVQRNGKGPIGKVRELFDAKGVRRAWVVWPPLAGRRAFGNEDGITSGFHEQAVDVAALVPTTAPAAELVDPKRQNDETRGWREGRRVRVGRAEGKILLFVRVDDEARAFVRFDDGGTAYVDLADLHLSKEDLAAIEANHPPAAPRRRTSLRSGASAQRAKLRAVTADLPPADPHALGLDADDDPVPVWIAESTLGAMAKPGEAQTLILVACGASKLDRAAPARELYTGNLFRAARAYAEAMVERFPDRYSWRIVSALHGLVHPDEVIEPYEEKLTAKHAPQWGRQVTTKIVQVYLLSKASVMRIPAGSSLSVVSLAPELYTTAIEDAIKDARPVPPIAIDRPLRGLGIGQQLQWLSRNTPRGAAVPRAAARRASSAHPATAPLRGTCSACMLPATVDLEGVPFCAEHAAASIRANEEAAERLRRAQRPAGFGEVDTSKAAKRKQGQLKLFNPPRALTALGLLTALSYLGHGGKLVELRWRVKDAPTLAVDEAKRLRIVYLGKVSRPSTKEEADVYRRLHWGDHGRGRVNGGGVAVPPVRVLGPGVSVTYTTRKGTDRTLVDYVHAWGEGGGRTWEAPQVVEHRCGSKRCACEGALAFVGGSYTVNERGIVG